MAGHEQGRGGADAVRMRTDIDCHAMHVMLLRRWAVLNDLNSRPLQTFVFCCAHADQIKKYLSESKWGASSGGGTRQMRVTTIVSTNCTSAGEALRIIDQRDIIKSDFVLVSGDTVSNVDLAPVLEAHRSRRSADKNSIMTMVGI